MADAVVPVQVEDLMVAYGGRVALDRVSFAIGRGEVCAMLGRNGAGKSSLVRCLLGQQRPQAGRIRVLAEDAWRGRRRLMQRVGVMPETPDLPPRMSARQIGAFAARLHERWDASDFAARLARGGVPADRPSGSLSRGQRGQLALALALATRPELLVLDDPTLGLDAVARRALLGELVGELADRGTTVLLTSHDLAGVEGIADRVVLLREGRVAVDEALETLKERFRRITYAHRGATESAGRLAAALGGAEVVSRRDVGWRTELVVAGTGALAGAAVAEAVVEPMTLEDIFLAVCGEDEGGAR